MIQKKIGLSQKKNLKTLVEDYLERDIIQLETLFRKRENDAMAMSLRIFQLLGTPEFDVSDLQPDDLKETILKWHGLLAPTWRKIRKSFLDYRNHIPPETQRNQNMVVSDQDQDPSSPLFEFRNLLDYDFAFPEEKTYTVKVPRMPTTINLSFSSGRFHISMEGLRVLDSFLLQLRDAPMDLFDICNHCGKIIVVTRKGKRYHYGCAAKAKQKERWESDPEGCRENERQRYRNRKRKRGSDEQKETEENPCKAEEEGQNL